MDQGPTHAGLCADNVGAPAAQLSVQEAALMLAQAPPRCMDAVARCLGQL